MTMTKAHAKRLLLEANARIDECCRVSRALKDVADTVDDCRWAVLDNYNEDFRFSHEATQTLWITIRDAIDNLYLAIDAVKTLEGIENAKSDRLMDYVDETDF